MLEALFIIAALIGADKTAPNASRPLLADDPRVVAMTSDEPTVSAVITDDSGDPIVEGTDYPLGEIIALSARKATHGGKPKSVIWVVTPPERAARAKVSYDGLDICISPGTEPVEISVSLFCSLGDEGAVHTVKLRCGGGARPPPGPSPPGPSPTPPPQPSKVARLSVIVIEDVFARTPETAALLNAQGTWQQIRDAGHEVRFYDSQTKEQNGKRYAAEVAGKPLPILMLRDAERDKTLEAITLPRTIGELDQAVKKWAK